MFIVAWLNVAVIIVSSQYYYGTILTLLKGAGGHWKKYLEEKMIKF